MSAVSAVARSLEGRPSTLAWPRYVASAVQKFPIILDDIGNEHRGRKFAIIIDEAHSSQGGRTSAKMNIALAEAALRRRKNRPGTPSSASWKRGRCCPTRAILPSPPRPRTRTWRSLVSSWETAIR